VIYLLYSIEDVAPDTISAFDWAVAVDEGIEEVVVVIHAMPLNERERRRDRKRRNK
jgi:hypothetical protein